MRLRDHVEKLNYYVAAVEHGTLRKASQAIGIGQPQLTKVINQLEDLLQTQLVIRSRKGITTTQEGEKLYKDGKNLLKEVDRLEFAIHTKDIELDGEITIGTYDSISRYFFPDFIKYMKSLFPNLSISLYTGRSKELISKLERNQIDFSVFVGTTDSKKLETKVVYEDYFSFYQTTNLEKAFIKSLIYFPETVESGSFTSYLAKYNTFHRCENLETVLSLTVSGLGVGLLPMRVAQEYVLSGHLKQVNLKHRLSKHRISIAKPANNYSKEAAIVYDEVVRFLGIWSRK